MDKPFLNIKSGTPLVGDVAGFLARTVIVDNYTNQYLVEESTGHVILPYTAAAQIPVAATAVIRISVQQPIGAIQAPVQAVEFYNVFADSDALPYSAGSAMPVGATGSEFRVLFGTLNNAGFSGAVTALFNDPSVATPLGVNIVRSMLIKCRNASPDAINVQNSGAGGAGNAAYILDPGDSIAFAYVDASKVRLQDNTNPSGALLTLAVII